MVKSDLWISKNKVSALFKVIFEKSFTIHCITEGFRKCGIFPFNPNAVDKSLLVRSSDMDIGSIDLSTKPCKSNDVPVVNQDDCVENTPVSAVVDNAFRESESTEPFFNVSFTVGDDDILTLEQQLDEVEPNLESSNCSADEALECPPNLALTAVELSLTPRKKRKFEECFDLGVDLQNSTFQTWRRLKTKVAALDEKQTHIDTFDNSKEVFTAVPIPLSDQPDKDCRVTTHPLVKAGLIPDDLVNVLVAPKSSTTKTGYKKEPGKARVLTSQDVQQEFEEKENTGQ